MSVFENIKKIIKDRRSSQKEVAENINLSQNGLGKSLSEKTLKVIDLLDIASFLKVDVCEFFKEDIKVKAYEIGEENKVVNEREGVYGERVSELKYTIDLQKKEILRLEKELKGKNKPIKQENKSK